MSWCTYQPITLGVVCHARWHEAGAPLEQWHTSRDR